MRRASIWPGVIGVQICAIKYSESYLARYSTADTAEAVSAPRDEVQQTVHVAVLNTVRRGKSRQSACPIEPQPLVVMVSVAAFARPVRAVVASRSLCLSTRRTRPV
jgi:hypothetical protein